MLASIQDVRSYTTSMEYDGFDRLSKTIYPDNSYEQYTFNKNSQVLTARTRNADTITNTYDVLTRLSTRQPGSSLGLQTLSYDLANRLTQISTPVISGDPATGNFQFGFDTAGRLITQTMPDSKIISYQLDGNSNRTKLTWPDSYYADYVFDKLNRLTDIKLNGASTSAIQLAYDPLSRRTSLTYENGSSCAYSYYINNDLATLAKTFVGSSVTFNFDYNKIHQVIGTTCTDSNYVWTPAVDNTVSYATANNLNQYPAVGGTNYSYNNNGCVTAGLITASYDALNRVTQAVSGSNTNNYWTDPLNRQIQKSVNGTKTLFLNDGLQQIASYNGSGSLTNRFIPGINLDELFISISGSSKTYLHSDRLGSLIAESNSSGTVMNKFAFSPFGESYAVSGTGFGYTGQRFDQEINSYYYRARYYSPSISRFWQPDPIGFAGGMNFYAYVGNDAVNLTDPLGLAAVCPGVGKKGADAARSATNITPGRPEYGSLIYADPQGGVHQTPPTRGVGNLWNPETAKPFIPSWNQGNIVGDAHSHPGFATPTIFSTNPSFTVPPVGQNGNLNPGLELAPSRENPTGAFFSGDDRATSTNYGLQSFLGSPTGSTRFYNGLLSQWSNYGAGAFTINYNAPGYLLP